MSVASARLSIGSRRARLGALVLLVALAAPLGGCTVIYRAGGPNEAAGSVVGAVAGGLIGSTFGGGAGRVVAAVAGSALGSLVGGAIGRELDEDELDRAGVAEVEAFETGRVSRWEGGPGRSGWVETTVVYRRDGAVCRDYAHTVLIDGRPRVARGVACRVPGRGWRIVS